jgi:hypothetical protein
MRHYDHARREKGAASDSCLLWLCVLAAVPPTVIRSEAAASFLLLIVVLALPWSRVFTAFLDTFALASWLQIPALALGVAINATILYLILGGRFRTPDA